MAFLEKVLKDLEENDELDDDKKAELKKIAQDIDKVEE
jgi:hypothetical protein